MPEFRVDFNGEMRVEADSEEEAIEKVRSEERNSDFSIGIKKVVNND